MKREKTVRNDRRAAGLPVALASVLAWMLALASGFAAATAAEIEATGFAREMPPGAPMGAAYVTLRDLSGKARELTGVELPGHPRGRVTMHDTLDVAGVSRMRALEKITLPGSGTIEMRPGATHLMVEGVALRAGEILPVKLVFADGSNIQLALPVLGLNDSAAGTRAAPDAAGHAHHHHHEG
ncbi:copper chaperone PCu(A)C [Microbulbifer sp. CAU 1566]|uniref:copper chaperone PCu(A)C n=1 Tax=Microbulbifer sp. CAU 1566 TaxID=2933269 RepID=UPI00200592DC|nr:copper chaperone PCu(A)C [Microbulbifer sp. CAU 1566]MCK7599063.1 copper chaperone PCu(A)C [Microbulbifer sp. CAU 1566]